MRARVAGRESTVTHRRVTRGARVDLVRMAARARRSLVVWDTVVSVRSRTLETTVKRSGVVSRSYSTMQSLACVLWTETCESLQHVEVRSLERRERFAIHHHRGTIPMELVAPGPSLRRLEK